MSEPTFFQRILRGLYHYLLFFLLVAFLVSCTMSVFVNALARDLDLVLTGENLNTAAKLTFGCVLLLSALITAIDILRRKLTTDRITGRIIRAARQIVQGDFRTRIQPAGRMGVDAHFGEIIDCFNTMARELESVEMLRSDFIANVSHEMKTPLAVLQNYGTLLQAPDLPEEKRLEYARGVREGSRRLADMMTNILKLNRLENQKIFPQTTSFDLGEQLCQCILQYETLWEQQGIDLETEIADGVTIQADRELMSLVWNNLLSNAFKFTPPGGRVSVSLKEEDGFAVVRISDTGCGMSSEVGSHIFEKFYQGDPSRSAQGNGLGLALVKRVVDILRCQIEVESTLGEGSTFTVRIGGN